jgi:hypothetical protein
MNGWGCYAVDMALGRTKIVGIAHADETNCLELGSQN